MDSSELSIRSTDLRATFAAPYLPPLSVKSTCLVSSVTRELCIALLLLV